VPPWSIVANRAGGKQDWPESEFQRRVEILDRLVALCQEACGLSDFDVRDEQPFFTVWLVATPRPNTKNVPRLAGK
jgi:hypothetical protein